MLNRAQKDRGAEDTKGLNSVIFFDNSTEKRIVPELHFCRFCLLCSFVSLFVLDGYDFFLDWSVWPLVRVADCMKQAQGSKLFCLLPCGISVFSCLVRKGGRGGFDYASAG